jgi:hypothetical protein
MCREGCRRSEIIDAGGQANAREQLRYREQASPPANVTERAGKHFRSISASMKGEMHHNAVNRGNSLLMEAAALRQQADGIEARK